jgi:sortase A
MDKKYGPRSISLIEAVAALFVLFIWSAVFVAGVAIALTYLQDQAEVAASDLPPVNPVAIVITESSTSAPPGPVPTDTPLPATATALPATATALPAPTKAVPTATFTRVIVPTPVPGEEASQSPQDTPTPLPIPTVMPTYVHPAQIAMAPDGSIIHSVSAGETLSSIASLYGQSIESLIRANHIDDPTRIAIGQKLTVPKGQQEPSGSVASLSSVVPASNSASNPNVPPLGLFSADMPPPPPAGDPPTRLVIPKISVDTPVVHVGWHVVEQNGRRYSEWDVADNFAGWHRGSAFPGNLGNVVVSGHHNIKGEVFRDVVELEAGDSAFLYVGEQFYPYTVTEKHILREKGMSDEVRSQNARWIAKTTDERLTLVTCWPYTNNTHRVIVVAKPTWKMDR